MAVSIDDFELLAVVGKGRWGKVMQVQSKESGVIYAMKVLRKETLVQSNQMHHAKRERQLLELTNHPFIVKLHYAFQTRDKLYLILDWVNGGELYFHLKREKMFPEDRVRLYVAQLALALQHLHSLNVIYRDLKLENVLLDGDGNVKLTDFGLAKQFVFGETKTYTFCGTPEYLAPEVLDGEGYGVSADWWCLGALTYEMTHGLPPFYSTNLHEMYARILSGEEIPLKSSLSPEIKSLLRGFLTRSPERRLGSGPGAFQQIKSHPFFAGLDWDLLLQKRIAATFIPQTESSLDIRNFDNEFTRELALDSPVIARQLSNPGMLSSFSFSADDTLRAPEHVRHTARSPQPRRI
eukprot:TRINITY_DN3366_c0_g1_i1.p1 TRINITY_DN3366_c0_g1~~TRINITY_DN3366_c0_g1_i1.p1  ORF type:complete len:351 (+),score=24.27 TRINITY_DN3366_c0_g1_i1:46-1098(+)